MDCVLVQCSLLFVLKEVQIRIKNEIFGEIKTSARGEMLLFVTSMHSQTLSYERYVA